MNDAARQIGVTGGTRLSYDRLVNLEQGNGGWRIRAAMTATYPDGARAMEMYCRATPTQIIQLDSVRVWSAFSSGAGGVSVARWRFRGGELSLKSSLRRSRGRGSERE